VLALDAMTGEAEVLIDTGAAALVEASGPFGLPVPGESCELEGRFADAAPRGAPEARRPAPFRGPGLPPAPGGPGPPARPLPSPPRPFAAGVISLGPPGDTGGFVSFLTAGYILGLDRAAALELVKTFGKELLDVLTRDPQRLAGGGGLPPGARERVIMSAGAFLELKALAAALAPKGLGAGPAAALLAAFGPDARDVLRNDPRRAATALASRWPGTGAGRAVLGTGVWAAMRLRESSGPPPESRAAAGLGVLAALSAMQAAGDLAVPETRLGTAAARLMPGEGDRERLAAFREGLYGLARSGEALFRPPPVPYDPRGRLVLLHEGVNELSDVETRLAALVSGMPMEGMPSAGEAVDLAGRLCGFPLDEGQEEAIRALCGRRALLTAGPRGSGKKLTASLLGAAFRKRGVPVQLASVTGRGRDALARISGVPALTLQELLRDAPGGLPGPGRDTCLNSGGAGGAPPAGRGAPADGTAPGLVCVAEAELMTPGELSRLLLALRPGSALALFAEPGRFPPPVPAEAWTEPDGDRETLDGLAGPKSPGGAAEGAEGWFAWRRPLSRAGPGGESVPDDGFGGLPDGLPGWLASLARGRPEPPQKDPTAPVPRPGPRDRLMRPARLAGAYGAGGSTLLDALSSLGVGKAPPGSATPAGDFFWLPGSDEAELSRKAVRLIAERVPPKLGIPAREAALALAGGDAGPLGALGLHEALHARLAPEGGRPGGGGGTAGAAVIRLRGRPLRPGERVMQTADDPRRGLVRGDRGTVVSTGPGPRFAEVSFGGREIPCGPDDLGDLMPCWALAAREAPPWAAFPAVVVALGRGAEKSLDRSGLVRAASLAEKLLVITGLPEVYARILARQ
jgi:hypothetical protein